LLPSGVILNGDLKKVYDVDLKAPDQVQEWVTHSWYKQGDENKGLHPFDGVTEPNFVLGPKTKGTKTSFENVDESAKYSWVKSPRWKGNAVEVGPLARYLVAYARGNKEVTEQVTMVLKTLDVPVTALFSTLGRTAARGLEASWSAHKMKYFYDQLMTNLKAGDFATANVDKWEPSTWGNAELKGVAPCEAPRGALAHWVKIKDTRIESYQCVVPTTWNAGPRDAKNQIGAYEAALLNTPMVNPAQPLEILRTIHSFDPCLACASHVMSPEGEEIVSVKVS
jgi:hydrogenase large subunit